MSRSATIYAHIDAAGAVLYVGRTIDLPLRTRQHELTASWWPEVVEVRALHRGLAHEDACRLEREEIEVHDPPHNFIFTTRWKKWREECGEHGYIRYSHGCRCDECKAGKAAYVRERRRVARELAAKHTTNLAAVSDEWPAGAERHYVPGVKHGTSYAYYERGCRCLDCTRWNSAESLRRFHRRKKRAA